jgi:serine/threonine protein kinase
VNRDDRGVREDVPLHPGDVVAGKYQVERVLGRGGVGIVAQVRHADLGQRFRLKYLPVEACEAPDAVSRFLRGARRAMRLQSEHTARTVDAGRLASGAPYVVTESNAGSDMREVLRVRGLLTVNEAVDFVLQASESLAEAHAQGHIHKNLNLSTLFVTWRPDGSHCVKVQDFGVAESLRADPLRTSDFNGEPVTMFDTNPLEALSCLSPEQIRSSGEIDSSADIWALGCILHQLLSGFPVFTATSVPGLLASIVADPAPPITAVRSDIPVGLENVILRCLEKNRGARFPSVADLGNALRPFASPDAQAAVDRITRTLGRAQQMSPGMERQFALVHVGPAAAPQQPTAQPTARSVEVPYPLIWSVALIALGLIGGTIAGVLVVTRLPPQQVVLEPRLNAQQPARYDVLRELPGPGEAPRSTPAVAQPLVAQPPVAQPAVAQLPVAQPLVAQPPVITAPPVAQPPVVAPPPVAAPLPVAAPPTVRTTAAPIAVARAKPSPSPRAAAPSLTAPPTSESAPTANLGKDLFESVR